jgi:DNA-binding MarR family transcriptional regulator
MRKPASTALPAVKLKLDRVQPRTRQGTIRNREFREFIAELFAAGAGMQSLRRAIARSVDLGGTELAILLAIWRLERSRSIGVKGLAEHLHVAGPHITDEVARLVRLGHLQKSVDRRDGRAINLRLSKHGRALLESLAPILERINQELFEGFTALEMQTLRRLFQHLIARSSASIKLLRPP